MSSYWGLALAFTAGASQRDATASYGDWRLGKVWEVWGVWEDGEEKITHSYSLLCAVAPRCANITHYSLPIIHYPLPITNYPLIIKKYFKQHYLQTLKHKNVFFKNSLNKYSLTLI